MRKYIKTDLCNIIDQLVNVNETLISKGKGVSQEQVQGILTDCQQDAVDVGNKIEEIEGEGTETVRLLEEYCEKVYLLCINWADEKFRDKELKNIRVLLNKVKNSILYDIKDSKKEVVFLPYKASMWDSLESVWKAADEDLDCDAYVIPIPYYDKNADGSFAEMHYEGDLYPDYVPVTSWQEYDLEKRHPDVIFIHNPYDGGNHVTSVHPFFYSKNIKKFTEKLVYIPYFVFPGNFAEHFALTSGVLHSDCTYVQNDITKNKYIATLCKQGLNEQYFSNRIFAVGTPKTDKVYQVVNTDKEIPRMWREKLIGKKVVFLNTNVGLILKNSNNFIDNMERIFGVFEQFSDTFSVIWREHPLSVSTIKSLRPDLLDGYYEMREKFLKYSWGVLDENVELYDAMRVSDCYYGAGGSLITLYSATGKPMLVTDYSYPTGIAQEEISLANFLESGKNRTFYHEKNSNTLSLYLSNLDVLEQLRDERIEIIKRCTYNIDGTVGEKIYNSMWGE